MKQSFLLILILLLLHNEKVIAQVSFIDPTPNPVLPAWFTIYYSGTSAAATTSVQIPAPSPGTSLTMHFTAKVFRNRGAQTTGYVNVFAGTGPTSRVGAALTSNIQVQQWLPVYDAATGNPGPYEYATVTSSNFTLSSSQAGTNTGLYAAYYSTTNGSAQLIDVSPPVLLGPASPTGTGPGTTNLSPSTVWPCHFIYNYPNKAICSSQHVPHTTSPTTLHGRALADPSDPDYMAWVNYYNSPAWTGIYPGPFGSPDEREWVQWQYSSSNKWDDWHDINGNATGRDFNPWDCWATTYYRRKSTHIDYSGFDSRKEWYISNVVTIIPYTTINPGVYKIRNRYTQQLLGIGTGGSATIAPGTVASQQPDAGTANQQWEITPTTDGMYKIINRNSRQALEIDGGNTPQPPSTVANQLPYSSGLNQQWMFIPNGNYFTITSAISGQELEIPHGSTQQGATAGQWLPNTGSNWAQWELVQVNVTSSTRFPGVCTIRNAQSGKVLEIGGAATNAGATSNQWDYVNLASQEWTIEDSYTTTFSSGIYKIKNRNSGLLLDVPGGSLNDGVQVQQWYDGNPTSMSQQWIILETTPGQFVIDSYNALSSATSGVLGVDLSNINGYGASVQQQYYTGALNQEWIITPVSQNRTAGGVTKDLPALALYPNPASDKVTIVTGGQEGKVIFYDAMGTARKTIKLQTGVPELEVSVQELLAGVYHVQIIIPGQAPFDKQLIVKP